MQKVGVKGEICGRATIERAWRTEHGQHWSLRSPLSVILQKKNETVYTKVNFKST